jgi:hypothetical protein
VTSWPGLRLPATRRSYSEWKLRRIRQVRRRQKRFLISSGVIILFAATVIIATKGQLVRRPGALSVEGDIAAEHTPDEADGREDPRRSDPRDA